MATAREHMQADMIHLFAQDGEGVVDVLVDGEPVRVIEVPEEVISGEFERENVIRKTICHLPGTISDKVPGQLVEIDGLRWQVQLHVAGAVLVRLGLQRSAG